MNRHLIISLLTALVSLTAKASEDTDSLKIIRPVTSAYTIEAGSAKITDTYLSPLKYTGETFAFGYERFQAMKFNPEKWIMQLRIYAGLDYTESPAQNVNMWGFGLSASWDMMRRYTVTDGLKLAAGGITSLNLGALYSTRNGNNPTSAKASWNVGLTGMATYSLKIKSLPITLRYQPTLPLAGTFFATEYDQLYYEIYRGDTKGIMHFSHPFNYFQFDNVLTADIRFGSTALRIGYHGIITSTKAHHIVCNMSTHSLFIGISGEWISLHSSKKITDDTKIISAYY